MRIEEIEADSRFKAKAALVQVNAPLALIQTALHAEHATLKKVLEMLKGGQS